MDDTQLLALKSSLPGLLWPAVPNAQAASMMAAQYQLEQSQWLPVEELQELQLRQMRQQVYHAVRTVPHYRETFKGLLPKDPREFTLDQFRTLPILTREEIQTSGKSLHSQRVPKQHAPLGTVGTSGSTGRPITALTTSVTRFFWQAMTLRDHLWHRRDFSRTLAVIRPEVKKPPGESVRSKGWGPSTEVMFRTGPMVALSIRTDIAAQAAWLKEQNPDYLLTLPSNLVALAEQFVSSGEKLANLKQVRTLGEICDDKARNACRDAWGVEVADMYSSTEAGYLALQCPETDCYHVQAEIAFLEVLDEEGNSCQPGETGRIVVTPFHNLAMPLIRYEIGDYAEVGGVCSCGRGLPVLNRVLGRQRNMLVLPDGRKAWPSFPASQWKEIGGVRQLQCVQTHADAIEINYVAEQPLSEEDQDRFREILTERFGYPFAFTFLQHTEILRSPAGKFEDFISKVGG